MWMFLQVNISREGTSRILNIQKFYPNKNQSHYKTEHRIDNVTTTIFYTNHLCNHILSLNLIFPQVGRVACQASQIRCGVANQWSNPCFLKIIQEWELYAKGLNRSNGNDIFHTSWLTYYHQYRTTCLLYIIFKDRIYTARDKYLLKFQPSHHYIKCLVHKMMTTTRCINVIIQRWPSSFFMFLKLFYICSAVLVRICLCIPARSHVLTG